MLRVWEGPLATNWDAAAEADWWVGDHCSNSTEFMEEPRPLNIRNPSFWRWSWSKKCFQREGVFSGVSWGWMENGTQARQGCEGGFGLEALRGAPWGWSDPGVEFWPNGSVLLAFWHSRFFSRPFFTHAFFPTKSSSQQKRGECVCEWVRAALKERDRMKERSQAFFNCINGNHFFHDTSHSSQKNLIS